MKLGLVLSGGGARGISHIGALKAFDEAGIKWSRLSGTSAGSIVGSFYCYGYAPDEILEIVKSIRLFRYIRPAMSRSGLLKMETTLNIYKKYLPENDFNALKIPMSITAADLQKGETVFFEEGPLIPAIMASSAVPVVFHPVIIDGIPYIDGGIINNLPVEPHIGKMDKIVCLNCNPISDNYKLGNFRSLMERSLLLAINTNSYSKKDKCDLFLEAPELKNITGFEISKATNIFDIGYEYGKEVAGDILKLIGE